MILSEPQAMLTVASKMPGLDGQKMSKSYNNTSHLREDEASVGKKSAHADRPCAHPPHRSRHAGEVSSMVAASGVFQRRHQANGVSRAARVRA